MHRVLLVHLTSSRIPIQKEDNRLGFQVLRHVQVVVLDKLDYCATLNNLREVQKLPNFRFVKGSIQSLDLVSHVLESEEIDTVMHFAAQVCHSA
jgi:dTDP-D-glucose 4,6-dehydratase